MAALSILVSGDPAGGSRFWNTTSKPSTSSCASLTAASSVGGCSRPSTTNLIWDDGLMSSKVARQDLDDKYDNRVIIGVDEAGVGSAIGPIVACAAMADPTDSFLLDHVRDSKKLSHAAREKVVEYVREHDIPHAFGEVSQDKIDEINPLNARLNAMTVAARNLVLSYWRSSAGYDALPPIVIVDGDLEVRFGGLCEQEAITDADDKFLAVGLASILAKEYRDRLVGVWAEMYPHYGFSTNKGYLTDEHRAALFEHGPCPIHRSVAPVKEARLKWAATIKDLKKGARR